LKAIRKGKKKERKERLPVKGKGRREEGLNFFDTPVIAGKYPTKTRGEKRERGGEPGVKRKGRGETRGLLAFFLYFFLSRNSKWVGEKKGKRGKNEEGRHKKGEKKGGRAKPTRSIIFPFSNEAEKKKKKEEEKIEENLWGTPFIAFASSSYNLRLTRKRGKRRGEKNCVRREGEEGEGTGGGPFAEAASTL